MKKRSAWLDNTVAAVALLVAALIVYGLAYRLTVTRVPGSTSEVTVIHWQPQYRFANPLCQRLFQPAHQVDRRLRPSFWQQRITIDKHL